MIPCLTNKSLKLLVGTADERYRFSPEYFRKTHFPQMLHRYYQHQLVEEMSEKELLDELEENAEFGNRVYIVFGSTGSGKSELLCWLKDRWKLNQVNRPVVRVSRSELNPQILVRKCFRALGVEGDIVIDDSRWNLLLQKPVTIVNQMIWTTLAEFFETDGEIVPLALLLRPVIEANILEFSRQAHKGEISTPLEILSSTQFDELLGRTTLPLEIDYLLFRQSLLRQFDQFLFHGQDMVSLMKHLSKVTIEKQIRPLLLIDDLVQSVNIYASELLDHLINLEEGNWDIVIGLTPGALQETGKGQELTRRIMNLDTIDDRVKKLWLSDESGNLFYSFRREDVRSYIEKYLIELKKTQGFTCSVDCEHASRCSQFMFNGEDSLTLLPLNQHLVERIYDGIAKGKGKLRYMILNTKEILRFLIGRKTNSINKVNMHVRRDVYVEHSDLVIKLLAEWYADRRSRAVHVPAAWLEYFHYKAESVSLLVQNLDGVSLGDLRTSVIYEESDDVQLPSVIRDWIEGKKVNDELLEPIRFGVASMVQDVVKATAVSRSFTARSSSAIQRTEVENRLRYPVLFSPSKHKREEIIIERGVEVLEIAGFQQQKIKERSQSFSRFANGWMIAEWIYGGEMIREAWRQEVEQALGMELQTFAFQFYQWIESWRQAGRGEWASQIRSPITKRMIEMGEAIFLDWFALRDNMTDAATLENQECSQDFEKWFLMYSPTTALEKFHVHEMPLSLFLMEVQRAVRSYQQDLIPIVDNLLSHFTEKLHAIGTVSANKQQQVEALLTLRKRQEAITLPILNAMEELAIWCNEQKIHELHQNLSEKWFAEHRKSTNLSRLVPKLVEDYGGRSSNHSVEWLILKIDGDQSLRVEAKREIKKLLEDGCATLPQNQKYDILDDLRKHLPKFTETLTISLLVEQDTECK